MREAVTALCQSLARDPLLVQGAAGNVSWKDGDTLWVKASGSCLADAGREELFVAVDLAALRQAVAAAHFDSTPPVLNHSALRPSIETWLHAMLPHPVVLHLHAVQALAHLVCADAPRRLAARMPADLPYVLLDYAKPGAALAQSLAQALPHSPDTAVVLMRNHGVLLGADSVQAMAALLTRLTRALDPGAPAPAPEPALQAPTWDCGGVRLNLIADPGIQQLALDAQLYKRLSGDWALYPEQVVFLGAQAVCLDAMHSLPAQLDQAVFVRAQGVYAPAQFGAAKLAQLRCYYDVLARVDPDTALQVLSPAQVHELIDWDAERYRMQRVAASAALGDSPCTI